MSGIINLDDKYSIEQLGGYYRKHNKKVKEKIRRIKETVENETKPQKEKLNKAFIEYKDAVKRVLNRDDIRQTSRSIQDSQIKMKKAINSAAKRFFNKRRQIYENQELSTQKKKKMELEVYNKMLKKFFSDEDRKEFESMIRNNMVIILNSRQLKGSKLMKQITY